MKKICLGVLLSAIVGQLASCSVAQDGAMISANEQLNRGNYGNALEALERAENYTESNPAKMAEIYFLRGYIFARTGNLVVARLNLQQATKYKGTKYAGLANDLLVEIKKLEKKG